MAASPSEGRTATVMHLGGPEVYWALGATDAAAAAAGPTAPPTPAGAAASPDDAPAAAAAAAFAAWPVAATLLCATPRGAVLQQRLYDRPPLSPDALADAGCVTLLGDAMHAMIPSLGQGACAALEGALELAQCIAAACKADANADAAADDAALHARLAAALRRYETARLARATRVQLSSAAAGAAAYDSRRAAGGAGSGVSVAPPPSDAAAASQQQPAASFMDWLHGYESPHAEADARGADAVV